VTSNDLSLWITAVATAATAVVAGLGTLIAWLERRRQIRATDPIIECNAHWKEARHISLWFIARNKLPETLGIVRVRIVRPRHAKIGNERGTPDAEKPWLSSSDIQEPTEQEVGLRQELAPVGTPQSSSGWSAGESAHFQLRASVPASWQGGRLRIDFWVENKSAQIRQRRITIRRFMKAPPQMKIEEKASNHD